MVAQNDDQRRTLFDKTFKNRDGSWGLAAKPNLPLIVWLAATLVAYPLSGRPALLAQAISYGSLFTWAWLEIFQGANYFRRALGVLVLVYLLASALMHNAHQNFL